MPFAPSSVLLLVASYCCSLLILTASVTVPVAIGVLGILGKLWPSSSSSGSPFCRRFLENTPTSLSSNNHRNVWWTQLRLLDLLPLDLPHDRCRFLEHPWNKVSLSAHTKQAGQSVAAPPANPVFGSCPPALLLSPRLSVLYCPVVGICSWLLAVVSMMCFVLLGGAGKLGR